jgi:peptidylprolyl isomerase domain and WD repeat-containing protein 1
MHKETVCQGKILLANHLNFIIVLISVKYEFIFTMSIDGYLKFWKKVQSGVEFVKTFKAHLGKINGASLSSSETRLATVCSKDSALKIFDVVNFDLMHMIKLKF